MSDEPPPDPTPPASPGDEQRHRPGPGSDDFDPEAHVWDGNDWWTPDQQYWWDGLSWQPRVMHARQGAKQRPPGYWRDFWLGLLGTVVVNIVLFIALVNVSGAYGTPDWLMNLVNLGPWVINIGGLILFAFIRPRVAIGMLVAYGIALGLALLAGVVLFVLCFSGGAGVP